jgi:hypothetical protein
VTYLPAVGKLLRFHGVQEGMLRCPGAQLLDQGIVFVIADNGRTLAVGFVVGLEQVDQFVYGVLGHSLEILRLGFRVSG